MFEIVEKMRHGQCDMQEISVNFDQRTVEHLQMIMEEQALTMEEVIACILSKQIVTYPDGHYEIND